MANISVSGGFKQIAASANCSPLPCNLLGIFVSAASATPTITVYDSATTTTSTKVIDTFTPVASTWYPMPIGLSAGAYVVIGGTVSCTVVVG